MNTKQHQIWLGDFLRRLYRFLTMPLAIIYLTHSRRVKKVYGMPWPRRIALGCRFWWNHSRVTTGTSWRAHLVMAMKLLEPAPHVKGDVVECGCWKGGSTINLSLVCRITGRRLQVYDSFEGLPPPVKGDVIAERTFNKGFIPGTFGGTLQEVSDNVKKYGAIEVCDFRQGWYENTLPDHEGDIVMMFLDVDFYASLHDCLINLWPYVVDKGYVFLDEYLNLPYCAVFYSEKYWHKYFASAPPGLIGTGTGVQVGMIFTDPNLRFQPGQVPASDSIAYCIKGSRTVWDFYPDENTTPTESDNTSTPSEGNKDH